MFVVVYAYKVEEGRDAEFHEAWHDLTEQLYVHSGSLGARLHKIEGCGYVDYTQWPSRLVWEKAFEQIPPKFRYVRQEIEEVSLSIEKLYELDVIGDLLMPRTFSL